MSLFKNNFLLTFLLGLSFLAACSQERVSPAKTTTQKVNETTIAIDYSSPSVKGREIWGDLVPYNEVWRTGANEATTFSVDKDVTINGEKLAAGQYALFTIPKEKEWVIIFNKTAKQWGAYDYDKVEDALRINVKPEHEKENTESLVFTIEKNGEVKLKWEKIAVTFKVK